VAPVEPERPGRRGGARGKPAAGGRVRGEPGASGGLHTQCDLEPAGRVTAAKIKPLKRTRPAELGPSTVKVYSQERFVSAVVPAKRHPDADSTTTRQKICVDARPRRAQSRIADCAGVLRTFLPLFTTPHATWRPFLIVRAGPCQSRRQRDMPTHQGRRK
jgi:hypothetical protein